jgi:WD40 repeat protein
VACIETPVQSMVCSDHYLYVGTVHGCIEVWDVGTWRCIASWTGHDFNINAMVMSPDQRFLFSGSADTSIRMWDVAAHECVDRVEGLQGRDGFCMMRIVSLAVSSDGAYLYSGDVDSSMFVWTLIRVETGWCQDWMDLLDM